MKSVAPSTVSGSVGSSQVLNVCSGSSRRARSRSRDQISRAEREAAGVIAEGLIVEGVMTYRRRRLWKITKGPLTGLQGASTYAASCGKINSWERARARRDLSPTPNAHLSLLPRDAQIPLSCLNYLSARASFTYLRRAR